MSHSKRQGNGHSRWDEFSMNAKVRRNRAKAAPKHKEGQEEQGEARVSKLTGDQLLHAMSNNHFAMVGKTAKL